MHQVPRPLEGEGDPVDRTGLAGDAITGSGEGVYLIQPAAT
jgi:hypothetical protein